MRSLFVSIGFDIDSRDLNTLDSKLRNTKKLIRGFSASLVLAGISTSSFLKIAGEFEDMQIVFETLFRSAEDAKNIMRELELFTAKTPFNIKELTAAAQKLTSVNVSTKDLIPTLKILGDVAAGTKASFTQMADIFAQIKSGGEIFGRQMLRFRDNAIPIIDELANKLGVTFEEAKKITKGLSFEEFKELLITMTSEGGRFFDLMEKRSKLFLGRLSIIKDIIILISKDIGEKLLPNAKKWQLQLLNYLTINRKMIAEGVGSIFADWNENMVMILKSMRPLLRDFGSMVEVLGGARKVAESLFFAMGALVGFKIIVALGALIRGISFLGNAAVITKAKLLAIPLLTAASFLFLLGILGDIAAHFQGRKSLTGLLVKDIRDKHKILRKAVEDTVKDIMNVVSPLKSVWEGMFEFDGDKIQKGFRDVLDRLLAELDQFWKEALIRGKTPEQRAEIEAAASGKRGTLIDLFDIVTNRQFVPRDKLGTSGVLDAQRLGRPRNAGDNFLEALRESVRQLKGRSFLNPFGLQPGQRQQFLPGGGSRTVNATININGVTDPRAVGDEVDRRIRDAFNVTKERERQ